MANEKEVEKLLYYKNHKVYGKMFHAVTHQITNLAIAQKHADTLEECIHVFEYIDNIVQNLLSDETVNKLPELCVKETIMDIVIKYESKFTKDNMKDDINYLYYPIIVLGIIVAYIDSKPDIDSQLLKELSWCRTYIESRSNYNDQYILCDIWYLLAERLPRHDPPTVQDLEVEIQKLEENCKTVERRLPETIIVELLKRFSNFVKLPFYGSDLAKLGEYVTGFSQDSLGRKISSSSSQIPAIHKQKVDELNALLKKLKFDIEIKTKA